MTEVEDRLEDVLDELSALGDHDELSETQQGMIKSADVTVATVLERQRKARHLNEWYGDG